MPDWNQVTVDHVRTACDQYDSGARPKRPAQSTFLLFDGNRYPAKFIRGLAYKIAAGVELDPSNDYAGGMETVRFFSKLGLTTEHKGQLNGPSSTASTTEPPPRSTSKSVLHPKRLSPEQQSLLKLLEDRYGRVELEKSFPWLVVPEPQDMSGTLLDIFQSLQAYRGVSDFITSGFHLKCDFVVPTERIIVEYDERQHFTNPRAIALDHYPPGLQTGFDVRRWADECRRVQAVDSSPSHRDEQRAFYDSLRDILAEENGYTVVRLRDGDHDWTSVDASETLESVFPNRGACTGQELPEPSSSDKEILLSYMRRSKGDWYWEDPIRDVLQTSNPDLVNPIGNKIRQMAGKRWRESQFPDAEIDRMVSLIHSEAERIGDVRPPPILVPTVVPISGDRLRRLNAEATPNKIALVSHDFTRRDGHGRLGYTEHLRTIIEMCDGEMCDTILFSPWSCDGRVVDARSQQALFENVAYVQRIILEAGDLEAHSGMPDLDDVSLEVWLRDQETPFVLRQCFQRSDDPTRDKRRFIDQLHQRTLGQALIVICGESGIVSEYRSGGFNDSFDFVASLDLLNITVILNPVHTFMLRSHGTDVRDKRSYYSKNERTVVSVWNQSGSKNAEKPWTVFHDGLDRTDDLSELETPFVDRPDIRIGVVSVVSL